MNPGPPEVVNTLNEQNAEAEEEDMEEGDEEEEQEMPGRHNWGRGHRVEEHGGRMPQDMGKSLIMLNADSQMMHGMKE